MRIPGWNTGDPGDAAGSQVIVLLSIVPSASGAGLVL